MRTVVPTDGLVLREDTVFAPGVYHLPSGITIAADGVTLDGNGAVLVGSRQQGQGIRVAGRSGVTVTNTRLRDYYHGIYARGGRSLTLTHNQITATAELAPNSLFLDIWRGPDAAYGGAIFLWEVTDSLVAENDLQHQQSGLLTYHCTRLTVRQNQASYCSGVGLHLYGTCESLFEANTADYCCRFEPRPGERHFGHMGADAAGVVAVRGACRNVFRRNTARLGGDGFFLAGLTPDGQALGCDDNLFEENDGSLSPNIAFEATFCRGNVFRDNYADRSNYGFWLGFSWDTVIENNRIALNRQAGVAVENGHGFSVRGNRFQGNGHGLLIWTRPTPPLAARFAAHETSYRWTVEGNAFQGNGTGVRIAADKDHGIRPLPAEEAGQPATRPRDHVLRQNTIQDNRVGIELVHADRTIVEDNLLYGNVEANLRQEDARDTVARHNRATPGA